MALKEFKFKSKSLEELKKLSIDEMAELLPARQRRSIKRGFSDEQKKLMQKIEKKDNVKTHHRDMIVFPFMVGKTIKIYNGKEFVSVTIQDAMIGMFFGELALSRKKATHTNIGVTSKPTAK